MPTAPDPLCPAVVHGRAPYGRCICATTLVGLQPRQQDRRVAPRRVEDATLHYAREALLAAALTVSDTQSTMFRHGPTAELNAKLREASGTMRQRAHTYRAAETAAVLAAPVLPQETAAP